jgi:hypothetical protein
MNTGTVGLAVVAKKSKNSKTTKIMKPITMATCCQNQY